MKTFQKVIKLSDIAYHIDQADKLAHELYVVAETMSKGEQRLNEIIMSLRAARISVTNLKYVVQSSRK